MNTILKSSAIICISLLASSGAFASADIDELQRRLERLEGRAAAAPADDKASIEFGGLVEVEAAYSDDNAEDSDATSDITLATFELGLEAQVNPWLSAHGILLYEEGENEDRLMVDEAYIRMNSQSMQLFVETGRFTQSFGSFESAMISDPITLELGETKHHASLRAGYEDEGLAASLAVFNGDVQKGGDNVVNTLVAAAEWGGEKGELRYGLGTSWTNNMADTDGLQESFDGETTDLVGGWSVNACLGYGPLSLRGEYLAALDKFEDGAAEDQFDLTGQQPAAWNVEAGYAFELPLELAVRYEGADDFGAAEYRYGATLAWSATDALALGLEYQRADNNGEADTDTVTMQLAMSF